VDPKTSLDGVEKRKFLILPGRELDPSVVQLVASYNTDCAVLAYMHIRVYMHICKYD
jgi:hypothetical protein